MERPRKCLQGKESQIAVKSIEDRKSRQSKEWALWFPGHYRKFPRGTPNMLLHLSSLKKDYNDLKCRLKLQCSQLDNSALWGMGYA